MLERTGNFGTVPARRQRRRTSFQGISRVNANRDSLFHSPAQSASPFDRSQSPKAKQWPPHPRKLSRWIRPLGPRLQNARSSWLPIRRWSRQPHALTGSRRRPVRAERLTAKPCRATGPPSAPTDCPKTGRRGSGAGQPVAGLLMQRTWRRRVDRHHHQRPPIHGPRLLRPRAHARRPAVRGRAPTA